LAAQLLSSIWSLLAGVIVLVLPGLAWQAWFGQDTPAGQPPAAGPRPDPASRLADAIGLSMALTALAALATFLFGLRLTGWIVAAVYLLLAGLTAAGWIRHRSRPWRWPPRPVSLLVLLPLLATLSLFLIVIAWRLGQAASLVLPAWVDSIHHVLIVRVILEQGAIPANLQPYLPVPFYYHFGFHAVGAVFAFLTRLAPDQAVVVLGQVINAAVCLSVYRLGKSFWKDPLRPLGAALLVAFFAHMPAYYLTWGRYTLLAGLLLLPVAMAQAVEMKNGPVRKEAVARLAVLTGGLLLTHYLAAILLALFLGVLAAEQAALLLRQRSRPQPEAGQDSPSPLRTSLELQPVWAAWLAGAGLGLLIALPWLWRIWHFNSLSFQVNLVLDSPDEVYFPDYINYLWYLSGPRRNYLLLALGGLGALLALVPGRWWAAGRAPARSGIPPRLTGRLTGWFSRLAGRSRAASSETRPPAAQTPNTPAVPPEPGQAVDLDTESPPGIPLSVPGSAEQHALPPSTRPALAAISVVDASHPAASAPAVHAPTAGMSAAGALDASPSPIEARTAGLGPLLAWTALVVLLTIPYGVRLGPFRPDHMAILWFLPASLFASHLLVSACQALWKLDRSRRSREDQEPGYSMPGPGEPGIEYPGREEPHRSPRPRSPRARLPVIGLSGTLLVWGLLLFWGGRDTLSIVNTGTLLADAADRAALDWIEASTPADSRFWINVTGWQGSVYRGVDGGWWIQPLTGRSTALPAVLYSTGSPEYLAQITAWAQQAVEVKECSAGLYDSLRLGGSTHVYLHTGKGSLQPAALEGCAGLEKVYEGEGVVIYQVMEKAVNGFENGLNGLGE
jgi:hypothetical protein